MEDKQLRRDMKRNGRFSVGIKCKFIDFNSGTGGSFCSLCKLPKYEKYLESLIRFEKLVQNRIYINIFNYIYNGMFFIDIKNISFITQTGYVIEPGSGRNIYTNRWKHTFSFFIIVILFCYCKSFFF